MSTSPFHPMAVEAYSMPSSSYLPQDSHTFVSCVEDRSTEWKNHGGGWSDSRPKTREAATMAYREWLMAFVPPGPSCNECGIAFGVNGICHTYANRELLVGAEPADVRSAPKDEYAVLLFGKYGYGIRQLRERLIATHNQTAGGGAPEILTAVLSRVDNRIDDELRAWYKVATQEGIDVDAILEKNRGGGIATARRRLEALNEEREEIYQHYLQYPATDIRKEIKGVINSHCKDYLNMLHSINYITAAEKERYYNIVDRVLDTMIKTIEHTMQRLARNELL